ncbi:MAG: hypothetical protein ACQERF_07910 [Actinomycetota bacterium]
MEFLSSVLVLLHFLSWALVLGLAVGFLRKGEVPKGLMHSAISALVTGLLIVGVYEMRDLDVNHVKVGIKLVLAAVIAVLAVRAERKAGGEKLLAPIAGLTVLNMVVAVFV